MAVALAGVGSRVRQALTSDAKYRYYPFAWVLHDAQDGANPALAELARRREADRLSATQITRLADAALIEQAAPQVNNLTQDWIDELEALYQRGRLSDAQARQYLSQISSYRMRVRRVIRSGDELPFSIQVWTRAPRFFRGTDKERWVGFFVTTAELNALASSSGELPSPQPLPLPWSGSGSMPAGVANGGDTGGNFRIGAVKPGRYRIQCAFRETTYPDASPRRLDSSEKGIHERAVSFTGNFEVLPSDAPDPLKINADPRVGEQIKDYFRIEVLGSVAPIETDAWGGTNVNILTGGGSTFALPIGVAFDVIIRDSAGEYLLQSFTRAAPGGPVRSLFNVVGQTPELTGPTVTVILRSSIPAARATVDIFEMWDGEIVYEGVPVE